MDLRRGDEVAIVKDGLIVKAIIIRVLTSTLALARIMEGPLAGEEVEMDVFRDVLAGPTTHYIIDHTA